MSAILDALGYLGDALDKPGRAVRGLLAGKTREGLAAVPFSDSLGLTDPAERTSGSDLLRGLGVDPGDGVGGTLAGIGTEIATDPLTWLGAGLGARLGSKAGAAAAARGPMYETSVADLLRMEKAYQATEGLNPQLASAASRRVSEIGRNPQAARALSEVHPESGILGAGAEGLAFRQPDGTVVRLGRVGLGEGGRPIAEGVLPTTRAVDVPYNSASALRVERMPFVERAHHAPTYDARVGELNETLARQGLEFGDAGPRNMGLLNDRPVVLDPGAVDNVGFMGPFERVGTAADPGPLMGQLLDSLGGAEAIRAGRTPRYAARLASSGAALGGLAGVSSRL